MEPSNSTGSNSSIAYITSIHDKLETLNYEVLPAGTCYPERCVTAFTASEVECLAILEHRRWLRERQKAGWRYGPAKDVARRQSPYLVPWEELPDRAKEWNRSAVRSIPNLLASVNLAVVR
uniref:Ryanodine receptor Ryr domain-containing protein n=1 Tax=Muribaculaceae bacterium Z82 TaxID=2304548 RepID=A0A7C9JJF6_9BACT